MEYATTWFLDQIWTITAFLLFSWAMYKKQNRILTFIVFVEFIGSNWGVHSLISKDSSSQILDVIVPATQGLFSLFFGTLISLMFLYGVFDKSAVIVGLVYYVVGLFQFLLAFESITLEGVSGYPFEFVGAYELAPNFYAVAIVLILITLALSLGSSDDKFTGIFSNMRNLVNTSNKANSTYSQGCNHITNSKRG